MFSSGFLGVVDSWPLPHFPLTSIEIYIHIYAFTPAAPAFLSLCTCVAACCVSHPEAEQILILLLMETGCDSSHLAGAPFTATRDHQPAV